MGHYDVVPATDDGWEHPPFAAEMTGSGADQVLWARGTLDDKGAVVAILEAVERCVTDGFVPENDVYLCFGHDEETYGSGARRIVGALRERGVRPTLVVDEGGAIVEGIFPGVTDPIAVIGVSEKGIAQLTLSVAQLGGHASTPPPMPATARLARAIVRLNDRPFPATLSETNLEMLRTLGAHATGRLRTVLTRPKLFRPVLVRLLARMSDETRALVRTTAVVTQLSGGLAGNALAEEARAVVNVRIAVGSSVAESVERIRAAVGDDLVRLEVEQAHEPSPVSPASGPAWAALARAVGAAHPMAIVTPYIMLAASDARHFTGISDNVFRFTPFEMSAAERGTLHARNERIRTHSWARGIAFYAALIASR